MSLGPPAVNLSPPVLPNSFFYPHYYECSMSAVGSGVFTTFVCVSVLLLVPISALVLSAAIQRWWRQRRTSTPKAISHSDFLTYNIIASELIGLLASVCYCLGIYLQLKDVMKAGIDIVFVVYLGRLLFQCLTCVEHYVAVIHPITYLSLKSELGLRARNISIGCFWLTCFGVMCLFASESPDLPTVPFFTLFAIGLLVISFCSLSVAFALNRPSPGEVGGDKKRSDQSKKKAFLAIVAIMGVMCLKYVGLVLCTAVHASSQLGYHSGCVVLMLSFWFCLPSSLSLPLLFLHRAGKLTWFSVSCNKSG